MTIEKGERSTSPVHLHVDQETPVHVHVKKPKKPTASSRAEHRMSDQKMKSAASFGDSNLRRSTARSKSPTRSKSPGRTASSSTAAASGPWVPPPGRSSKALGKYSWQGPSHRLEISTPQEAEAIQSTLRMSDLDTDEEDRVTNKMRRYEKKIDGLMSEVGTLKNEVSLQRTIREMEKQEDLLETSRRVLEEQEEELDVCKVELEASESENKSLRRTMDKVRGTADYSKAERDWLTTERDHLMKKLVEVEMDGQAAAQQVAALRDMTRRLREEKRLSAADSTMLAKQKELLMERLNDFEVTNRCLRRLLRERHEEEAAGVRLQEQRDVLLKKLTETEETVQRYRCDLMDKDRQLSELHMQNTAQKEENVAVTGLQSSLESNRAHLQKQLRQKDADCNRMAVQIRTMESALAQEKIDVDHMRELLVAAKEKADRDKEALKKATRVQKQRATKSEDALEQLNCQLMERENYIAEIRTEMDGVRAVCDKTGKEKSQAVAEATALQTRISELEGIMERLEDDTKIKVETATVRLHEKSSEAASSKLDNERLKTTLASLEDKFAQSEGEVTQLRANLRQYENLVDEYRTQMNRSRREADESMVQLEDQKRETCRVKTRLQARLQELEPIPELLKTTELRLQDANEKLLSYERRNTENTKLIAELTGKVEQQNGQMDMVREKFQHSQDDNRSLQSKMDTLEKKLGDIEVQNRELMQGVSKREEAVHQSNMRMDEKSRENASLSRQLEAALADARRQAEQSREKSTCKERAFQTRILDLESQLSQCRTDVARHKREKEEAERKFNSRLYDLKDRLEQANSTNRSMQNYVQFLKSSYANVFGDASFAAQTSSPMGKTYPH